MSEPDQACWRAAPVRILIVEDDPLNLKLVVDLLSFHGYDITATALGEEAVEIARRTRPDLILLDIQLPDISGLDVARRLKAAPQTRMIPIAAVTAFAMRGDDRKILDSGCDLYISKPLRVDRLLETVEALSRHRVGC